MPSTIQISPDGKLDLPEDIKKQLGFSVKGLVRIDVNANEVTISRSINHLNQVYIEPTNACNLTCSTCMRNVWDEPLGFLSKETFERILEGLRAFSPIPKVFFGGFGEPLFHPQIQEMVAAAKQLGAEVELITNGILLDDEVSDWMLNLGLDRVWVSIDGASPESYADVRLGDALPIVLENILGLMGKRIRRELVTPALGIAFVAMKRNIADLPGVIALGKKLGADYFSISNVLPHTPELRDEVLYRNSLFFADTPAATYNSTIDLPRMDFSPEISSILVETLKGLGKIAISGKQLTMGDDSCPFLRKGSMSIRWDGEASPCLPLMHTHTSYIEEIVRTTHAWSVGNINDLTLAELWNQPSYRDLRKRLNAFDFPPCTICTTSCHMIKDNLTDCWNSPHPTCGGCLWAKGLIQCP